MLDATPATPAPVRAHHAALPHMPRLLPSLKLDPSAEGVHHRHVLRQSLRLRRPVPEVPPVMLTYCTNIHPAEAWSDVSAAVRANVPRVRAAQVHVSAALRVPGAELDRLGRFCDPCYLRQTIGQCRDRSLLRFLDLPEAIASGVDGSDVIEWRVHFHVPVFSATLGDCYTTQPDLEETLDLLSPDVPLVVETYAYGAISAELRTGSLVDNIVRELTWVRERLRRRLGAASTNLNA